MLEKIEQPLHPACRHLTQAFIGLSLLLLDLDLAEQGAMGFQLRPLRQDRFNAAGLKDLAHRGGVERQGEGESHALFTEEQGGTCWQGFVPGTDTMASGSLALNATVRFFKWGFSW